MRSRITDAAVAGLCVLAIGTTGGCTSDPKPTASSTTVAVTSTPTPSTTTPSPTPTIDPTEQAKADAIKAVEDFYKAFHDGLESGSSVAFRKLFTKECQACLEMADRIDEYTRSGKRVVGESPVFGKMTASVPGGDVLGVSGERISPPSKIVSKATGKTLQSFTGGTRALLWTLKEEKSRLLMMSITAA